MTNCSKCEKEYNTYPVFLNSKDEGLAMEFSIRDIYYWDEKDEGLCEGCREELWKDPLQIWRLWSLAKAKLYVVQSNYKKDGNTKRVKEISRALKRIEEKEKELEKTPEIKQFRKENK